MDDNSGQLNEYTNLQSIFGKYILRIKDDYNKLDAPKESTQKPNPQQQQDELKKQNDQSGSESFIGEFIVMPLSSLKQKPDSLTHFDDGNRIIAPSSLSTKILTSSSTKNANEPLVLKISSQSSYTHCSILEYTADEGHIYVPTCILKHLELDLANNNKATLDIVKLERGSFAQFQPNSANFFTQIKDCKPLLEQTLLKYQCLTIGDRIRLVAPEDQANQDDEKEFYLQVVQVLSSHSLVECNAVHIINTDLITEFVPSDDILSKLHKQKSEKDEKDSTVSEAKVVPTKNETKKTDRGQALGSKGRASKLKKKTISEDGDGFTFIYQVDEHGNKTLLRKIPKRKFMF